MNPNALVTTECSVTGTEEICRNGHSPFNCELFTESSNGALI